MQLPKRRGEWKRDLPTADEYLTPDAIEGLKKELAHIQAARPGAVSELARTREMGDLSENFAYSVAKGKVMGMDNRTIEIKEQLKRVKPLKIGGNAGGFIAAGSIVTVEVNGKRKTLTLVGTQQADPLSGKISYHSPVGAALIGHLAGDEATVTANGKTIVYKIVEVK
jgi:transcription elongation factor GreA